MRSTRNARRIGLLSVVFTFGIAFLTLGGGYYHAIRLATDIVVDLDQPPSYTKLREYEWNLPQHNLSLPFPEGKTGRYVYFKNQDQRKGWNNLLNEVLMNSYLAYKSNRSYVFQDYVWNTDHYPWHRTKYRSWWPRTPANALLSGPSVGGPWPPGDPAPRSISETWFDVVCPPNERKIINTREIKPALAWQDITVVFKTWQKVLLETPDRCVEIQPAKVSEDAMPQTFDLWIWGNHLVLPIWEEFRDSPVSKLLRPSRIVKSAVDRNEDLFLPRGPRPSALITNNVYDRMLSVHLRRGDFEHHCAHLGRWNATYFGWNLLPFLPDKYIHPPADLPGYKPGKATPEVLRSVMSHCYPTQEELVQKIQDSKRDYEAAGVGGELGRRLDVLFLMTNDQSEWIVQLKKKMRERGWHTIATSRDLELDQEQKDVGMAVDMDIARRAAVFIGNGWSSFTSGIVHRRLVDKKDPISIRFY